ncbi:MAG: hypothetical protein Q8Q62_08995 [Mesorhizobium sp.]|nr:hypothetical protein [Mesorhizobium sp.]
MDARTAHSRDLAAVFSHLADRVSAEHASAGQRGLSPKDALFLNLKEGRAHALVDGGEPVAIVSWDESDDIATTSFAAAERFFTASTVRFCARHIRRIQALCGNRPIQSLSWSDRADVAKWFRVIGFVEIGRGDGYTIYELPPQSGSAPKSH